MFAPRYFATNFFTPRFFPPGGDVVALQSDGKIDQITISVSGADRPIIQLNQPLDEKSIYSQLYQEDEEIVAVVISLVKLGIL